MAYVGGKKKNELISNLINLKGQKCVFVEGDREKKGSIVCVFSFGG